MEAKEIMQVIPHRYPMLLVDRILELEPGKRAVGLKNVSANEWFFPGHYPGQPIMPGVLIMEACAQVGAVAMLALEENRSKTPIFAGMEKVRFRKPVVPGDQLRLEVSIDKVRGPMGWASAKAYVGEAVVAEGQAIFALTE